MFSALPLFWTAGLNTAVGATLAAGGCWVAQETFDPGAALALMARGRVTEPYTLPHQTVALAEHPDWAATDLSSLRCVYGKGAFARHPRVQGDPGWIMPVVAVFFIAYAVFGAYLPQPWTHRGYEVDRLVGSLYMTLEGIFGTAVDVSSSLIILFTIFGAFLQHSGAGKFFIDFSLAVMGGKRNAAGRAVVVSSFLLGGPSDEEPEPSPLGAVPLCRLRQGEAVCTQLLEVVVDAQVEFLGRKPSLFGTQMLAEQPEFASNARMRELLRLTEGRDLLKQALAGRRRLGLSITIGSENPDTRLSEFTLVTSSYQAGELKGVIGVMGPTRMPYDKIIGLVEHTSRMVEGLLE